MHRTPRIPTATQAWWAVSALALVFAVVMLAGVTAAHTPAVLVLNESPKTPPVTTPTTSTTTTPTGVPRSRPVELRVPALGIRTGVVPLGLQADGQIEVPATVHQIGWYDRGPTPGQMGSAVMLGHVDSYQQVGTFYYLRTMKVGEAIYVTLTDGLTVHFSVTRVVQYAKTAFPDRLVFGPSGTESLQLVTCGGAFDYSTGHYLANIVVFSHLVGVSGTVRQVTPTTIATSKQ